MTEKYQHRYLSYFLMYFFYFFSWALFSSLISVYLLDLEYKPSQVSLVVSTSFLASLVAQPIIGFLNDKYHVKLVTSLLFVGAIIGSIGFLLSRNLTTIVISYSWVLLLINGTSPVVEQLATTSRFAYGKIRIWGTVGYAVGSQIAGLIYDYVSPKAIFVGFIFTMILTIVGINGTHAGQEKKISEITSKKENEHKKNSNSFSVILKNKTFIIYMLMISLLSGVMNTLHTYLPAMLESDGLSIGAVSFFLALAVVCEGPLLLFSNLFMDKFKSKQLLMIPIALLAIQFLIYGLHINVWSEVAVTLLSKHTAGILYIMINMKVVSSLVDRSYLITALSLVQTARNLFSIILQNIVGYILDVYTYVTMAWFLLTMIALVFIVSLWLKLPDGNSQKLFS